MNWRAIVLAAAVLTGCELTPPERADRYGFRSQPDSLVFHWPGDRLPVRFFAQPVGALPQYLDQAIRSWEGQFLYGEFDGTITSDSAAAQVVVVMPGPAPPASPLTTAAPVNACDGRTTLPVTPDNRLAGMVVIRLSWFANFSAEHVANCLARVTSHEVGHALGLFQHSTRATDLMFGPPFGLPQVREPSPRDRATIQQLYHTPSDVKP